MPELSRRERNKASVRARLVTAALKLATRQGFEATTVSEITKLAGVAKGTFFNYFATKEALVIEHYEALFSQVEGIIRGMPPLAPREWFCGVFAKMANLLATERDTVVFVLRETHRLRSIGALEEAKHRRLHQLYVQALERGKADGYLSTEHNSDSAATVLQGIWSWTLEEWAGSAHGSMRIGAEFRRRVNLVFSGLERRS